MLQVIIYDVPLDMCLRMQPVPTAGYSESYTHFVRYILIFSIDKLIIMEL